MEVGSVVETGYSVRMVDFPNPIFITAAIPPHSLDEFVVKRDNVEGMCQWLLPFITLITITKFLLDETMTFSLFH